jgi:hypothetical protein
MTKTIQQPRIATRPTPAPAQAPTRSQGPVATPSMNLTYTIQKGAGSLPFLKK